MQCHGNKNGPSLSMNRALFALPLIALVAVPTLIATLDSRSELAFREHTVARDSARAQVRAVAARLDERIAALRNTIALIQTTEAVRLVGRAEECPGALTRATESLQGVQLLEVLDRTGRVICSSDPTRAGRLARADNALRTVLRGKADWMITSGVPIPAGAAPTGLDAFAVAVPLRDDAGNGVGAIVAATASTSLLLAASEATGATAYLIQEGGEVIGQALGQSTERAAAQTLAELRSFFVGRIATEVDTLGADGVRRVFGILPGAGHEHGVTVAVGVPVAPGAGGRSSGTAPLITLVVSTLLAGALAWAFRGRPTARADASRPEAAAGAPPDGPTSREPESMVPPPQGELQHLPPSTTAARSGNPAG
jgi:hypothetical protein